MKADVLIAIGALAKLALLALGTVGGGYLVWRALAAETAEIAETGPTHAQIANFGNKLARTCRAHGGALTLEQTIDSSGAMAFRIACRLPNDTELEALFP